MSLLKSTLHPKRIHPDEIKMLQVIQDKRIEKQKFSDKIHDIALGLSSTNGAIQQSTADYNSNNLNISNNLNDPNNDFNSNITANYKSTQSVKHFNYNSISFLAITTTDISFVIGQ